MTYFINYRNTKIHFTDNGSGNVILLLHGFLENLNMWNDLESHLTKTHRVICIDLLGHGKSEDIGYIHTMEMMAKSVISVLDYLEIKHVAIIGHSMGGYVGLGLLDLRPSLIKGLCLMNSTAISDSKDKKNQRDRSIEVLKENYALFVKITTTNLFNQKKIKTYQKELKQVQNTALKMSYRSAIASLEGMKIRKNQLDLFRNFKVPKMVIIGKNDAILNFKEQQSYYKNTDINVVELTDGHMSHIEDKEVFTYNIIRFIEKI